MGRPVVHWEFWSEDPDKVSEFYREVFDWDIQHNPEMDYWMADPGGEGGIKGGIMKPKSGPWPGNMAMYLHVEDLDLYTERIKEAGGKILVDKQEIPRVGTLSLFEDPDGRVLGMWKPAPRD